jgi:hypothetical protein
MISVSIEPQEGHLSLGFILNRSLRFAFAGPFDVSFDSSFGSISVSAHYFPLNPIQQEQTLSLKLYECRIRRFEPGTNGDVTCKSLFL